MKSITELAAQVRAPEKTFVIFISDDQGKHHWSLVESDIDITSLNPIEQMEYAPRHLHLNAVDNILVANCHSILLQH
jgi:hypothetical protein